MGEFHVFLMIRWLDNYYISPPTNDHFIPPVTRSSFSCILLLLSPLPSLRKPGLRRVVQTDSNILRRKRKWHNTRSTQFGPKYKVGLELSLALAGQTVPEMLSNPVSASPGKILTRPRTFESSAIRSACISKSWVYIEIQNWLHVALKACSLGGGLSLTRSNGSRPHGGLLDKGSSSWRAATLCEH